MLRIPLEIPGVESEEVGVEALGGDHYLVTTVPAVSTDCALGDVVRAHRVDEILEFRSVALAGGNRTLRLLVEDVALDHVHARLCALGLRVDKPLPQMLAVTLAPDSPAAGVELILEDLREQGVIQIAR